MSLKEIARLAGASISTVSRVLNQPDYHCANPELQERIWQFAREMHYTPNSAARQLKMGLDTSTANPLQIDIFLTRFHTLDDDLFFKELYEVLREELLKENCHLGRILTLPDITGRLESLSSFSASEPSANGLILLGKCPAELISFLKNQYRYLVGIDRNPTNFDYDEIICNGTTAAVTAMDYLISLGHKKIAYIGDCSYEARYIGYYQSLMAHKLPLDYSNIYPTCQTRQEGRQMMQLILEKAVRPSAIFCANDSTALGVLDTMKSKRKKGYLPSVISIDNIREAASTKPMLTTIDIPKREMAHHAVIMLMDRIKGAHTEHIRIELPCHLIVRESCSYCAE